MRTRYIGAVVTGFWILGCAGLLGYGEELGSTKVSSAKPFELKFTPKEDGAANLWLEFAVEHKGSSYGVDGDFRLSGGGLSDRKKWTLELRDEGSPVKGEAGRVTMYSSSSNMGGKGRASMTIKLLSLPELKKGSQASIKGRFVPDANTTVTSMRLIVTD